MVSLSLSRDSGFWKFTESPFQYSLVQRQQWKHQNNVPDMLKVNNKETRMTLMTSFFIVVNFENIPDIALTFPMLPFLILLPLRSPIYDVHKKWPTNDPPTSTITKMSNRSIV